MQRVLGDLHLAICVVFSDNVNVFAGPFDHNWDHLQKVFLEHEEWEPKIEGI